jgi:hypothetical protein
MIEHFKFLRTALSNRFPDFRFTIRAVHRGAGAPCPICNAGNEATVPDMPEGFQADTLNKHSFDLLAYRRRATPTLCRVR